MHGPNATLVGSDTFGNKYYQRMTEQFGALCLGCLTGDRPPAPAASSRLRHFALTRGRHGRRQAPVGGVRGPGLAVRAGPHLHTSRVAWCVLKKGSRAPGAIYGRAMLQQALSVSAKACCLVCVQAGSTASQTGILERCVAPPCTLVGVRAGCLCSGFLSCTHAFANQAFGLKQGEVQMPIYHVPHFANKTGTLAVYSPKGSWRNPQKRNWKKVEAWDHTKA